MMVPALAGPALASHAKGERSSIALLSAGRMPDGAWRAGLRMSLDPGFKTYWRDPGDSGVPPVFDWSGSRNVARVEVEWPAPRRFFDGVGWSIGYMDEVILPLRVVAEDPGAPVVLDLKLDYAVCEQLCIPTGGHVARTLEEMPREAAELAPFLARVPKQVEPGQKAAGLSLKTVTVERNGTADAVVATIAGAAVEDVFVEGPAGWYFDKTALAPGDGGTRAATPIAERPKDASGPLPATLTIVGPEGAITVSTRLDLPPKAR